MQKNIHAADEIRIKTIKKGCNLNKLLLKYFKEDNYKLTLEIRALMLITKNKK